jgi:hypothetical protein
VGVQFIKVLANLILICSGCGRAIRSCLILLVGLSALTSASGARAQANESFMAQAIGLAQASQRVTTVPASVTIAQAIWETGRGKSPIGDALNFFGIKAAGTSDENVNVGPIAIGWVWATTKEWEGGKYVTRQARFRKYRSMQDSFRDHGYLLAMNPRYAEAMGAVDDPREFVRRMARAGYATSPTYANDLIDLMDSENLYQYDLPRNAAQVLGQASDISVNPGEIFQVYFDVKNTGFGTWSPTADYVLENVNGEHFSAVSPQPIDLLVQPDRIKRWTIIMVAPAAPGNYRTVWQMKHGARPFGTEMSVKVVVRETGGVTREQLVFAGAMLLGLVVLGAIALLRSRK